MKFTSKDLMKAMGLQVGDRIRINNRNDIYIIELNECDEPIYIEEFTKIKFPMFDLINKNVKILPRPKRVGELDCFVEIKCNKCPLRMISGCANQEGIPLYDILQAIKIDSTKNNMFDQETYDLLKARLDKEVE